MKQVNIYAPAGTEPEKSVLVPDDTTKIIAVLRDWETGEPHEEEMELGNGNVAWSDLWDHLKLPADSFELFEGGATEARSEIRLYTSTRG